MPSSCETLKIRQLGLEFCRSVLLLLLDLDILFDGVATAVASGVTKILDQQNLQCVHVGTLTNTAFMSAHIC